MVYLFHAPRSTSQISCAAPQPTSQAPFCRVSDKQASTSGPVIPVLPLLVRFGRSILVGMNDPSTTESMQQPRLLSLTFFILTGSIIAEGTPNGTFSTPGATSAPNDQIERRRKGMAPGSNQVDAAWFCQRGLWLLSPRYQHLDH